MGSFGEDLRAERISRGIALEDITAVTKISQRHLVALEQERFRQLPGGILSKGIVRGYVGAVGLNVSDWTDRFIKAYTEAGQTLDGAGGWAEFAANVGQERIKRREAAAIRLRWAGAVVLMAAVTAVAFLTVRYFGLRAGWWDSLIPLHAVSAKTHAMFIETAGWFHSGR